MKLTGPGARLPGFTCEPSSAIRVSYSAFSCLSSPLCMTGIILMSTSRHVAQIKWVGTRKHLEPPLANSMNCNKGVKQYYV